MQVELAVNGVKDDFFTKKFPLRVIWYFTSHQQFFSYVGACLPGLNQH